jgi:pimeloyl-ACP methyl ester carboxylesterase
MLKNDKLALLIRSSKNFFIDSSCGGSIFVSATMSSTNPKGTVIIVPPFGRVVHDGFLLTAYLLENGFNVIRFDARHHVGFSSGDVSDFKMSHLEKDLNDVVSANVFPHTDNLILLGLSLSAPVVWKVAAITDMCRGVVTLVGAVDLVETIQLAGGFSLQPYFEKEQEVDKYKEIFGLQVLAQPFVDDLIESHYESYERMNDYIQRAKCGVLMVAAADDNWVSLDKIKSSINPGYHQRKLALLDGVGHEIGKSAAAAKRAAMEAVKFCHLLIGSDEESYAPRLTTIISASTIESNILSNLKRNVCRENLSTHDH